MRSTFWRKSCIRNKQILLNSSKYKKSTTRLKSYTRETTIRNPTKQRIIIGFQNTRSREICSKPRQGRSSPCHLGSETWSGTLSGTASGKSDDRGWPRRRRKRFGTVGARARRRRRGPRWRSVRGSPCRRRWSSAWSLDLEEPNRRPRSETKKRDRSEKRKEGRNWNALLRGWMDKYSAKSVLH